MLFLPGIANVTNVFQSERAGAGPILIESACALKSFAFQQRTRRFSSGRQDLNTFCTGGCTMRREDDGLPVSEGSC